MNHRPQDQGPNAGRDPAQGGARHRVDSGPGGHREPSYSDAARYLDSAWESSSTGTPATPYDGPTQVVPVQEMPIGPQPTGPQAAGQQPAGQQPAGPLPARPQPAGPRPSGAQPSGAQPAGPVPPEAGRPELDLGAYAMGAPQPTGHGAPGHPGAAGGHPGADGPTGGHEQGAAYGFPAAPGDGGAHGGSGDYGGGDGGRGGHGGYGGHGDGSDDGSGPGSGGRGRRRRALVVWGVAGAVALTGAGLVAAKTLTGDDKPSTTSVGLTTSPTPSAAPSSAAPPSTASPAPSTGGPSTGSSSGRPSGSASSGSKSPSGSPSGSASTGSKTPKTDSDDDGIADDPGATDPSKLVGGARTAYQQAKSAMAADGVTMTLTSGKRSYEHQKDLWDQEVRDKGSTAAARMRVLPPDESSHVDGNAIDINVAAQPWMRTNGKKYGWCQIYANEAWHFEYQASYKTAGCPALKPHP